MIDHDLLQQAREAAAAVAAGWALHARLSDRPQIALNAVALDERGSETRNLLDMTRIHKSLLEGQRIILEGPAGCGKTTTLIQLAQISGNSQCVPLLVDLPGWITSGIDILEHLSSNAAFLSRGIDAATLACISLKEPCLFLINGLNEISDLYRQNAAIRLQALVRDFPAAGVIVATRTQRIAPQLPGSTRVKLLPLTVEQRFNYLEQALGTSQAQVLHSRLSGDRVLDGLTCTALFLGEITTIFRLGHELPRTKFGLLGAAVALIEHDHGIHLQTRPLQGRAEDYLRSLAIKLTTRGDVILGEAEARAICGAVSENLSDAKQLAAVPDQVDILDTLCAHHILENDYPGTNLRFQHQLFQEYYSALSLRVALTSAVATADPDERASFAQKYINEPAWEEPLLMIAEEIGASNSNSASADKLNAGKFLVRATLWVDPILAGTLARLSGLSTWKAVRTEVSERLRALYAVPNRHYRRCALAAMLATGSDEFADIIIPLLTDADQQVRDATYRAGPDFHPSSLGSEWQKIVAGWTEPSRIEFISELTLHKRRTEVALTFARSDPSLAVRIEAIRALAWVGQSREVAELLQAFPDKDFQQALQRLDAVDIPPPLRSRAISNYQSILAETTDPKARFQISLHLAELGDEDTPTRLKNELTRLPAAIVKTLSDYSLPPAIEIIRYVDPQWVSQWVADRIIEGALWPDAWLSMVVGIPKSLSERLLQCLCSENLQLGSSGRIISLLAATADTAVAKAIFGKLREHREGMKVDPRNEEKHAIDVQLTNLFKAIPVPVALEALSDILAREPVHDELSIITEIFGDIGPEGRDLRSVLPNRLRQQLRQYFKTTVSGVLADDHLGGQDKARLASALGEVGEPDDSADLLRLIKADIERVRIHGASFQQGGPTRNARGNMASYSCQHVQGLVRLAQARAESTLIDLLQEPEYEIDAAWGLREIVKTQPSVNPIWESRFGWPTRDYRRARNGPPEWPTNFDEGRRVRCVAAVTRRIVELREESHGGDHKAVPYHHRLKELAIVLADTDPKHSSDLILEIAALPASRDGWLRVALLEGLVFGGSTLPTEVVMGIVDPVIEHLRAHGTFGGNGSLLGRLLCILPFVDSPAQGVARIHDLLSEFRLTPHRGLLIALGQSPCDQGLSLLGDLARQDRAAFEHYAKDWIEAVAACPLPRAKLLLLRFVDPGVSEDVGSLNLPDYAANFLASRLSDLARADESLVERILQLSSGPVLREHRLVLTKTVTRLDASQALIASLDLIDDESPPAVPYDLWRAIEELFLEKRPQGEEPRSYRLVPRSGSDIKRRLLEMVKHDPRRACSAYDLLGQIEVWRLEYGRPSSEPRHPALQTGEPWPPLQPDRGEAGDKVTEHVEQGSGPISREERLQAFIAAHLGTSLADIKYSAPVHTPEFQDWRKDQLKQESVMSRRIEDVLSGATSLKKKPRKSRRD